MFDGDGMVIANGTFWFSCFVENILVGNECVSFSKSSENFFMFSAILIGGFPVF